MITTFSGAPTRSETSDAGKFSLAQYQRLSSASRTWPSSARKASRSSVGTPESAVARVERQLEGRRPDVGQQYVQVGRDPGGLLRARNRTGIPGELPRTGRPARRRRPGWRPTVPAFAPTDPSAARSRRWCPDSRPGLMRPGGRYRCPAPARWSTPRRGLRPTAARPRSRAARWAGSRRGSHGCACAARSLRAVTRASRSAAARRRCAPCRRRSSAGPRG